MKTAVIFAAGELGCKVMAEEIRSRADIIIAADRGLEHLREAGITPDIIVGDFDSYTGVLPECGAEIHRSVPEKDDTDTILAVRIALERGCTEIDLWGALGGRTDHTIANIQTLRFAREHGCRMRICGGEQLMIQGAEGGTVTYPRRSGYFSVFALTDTAELEYMRGVKYPLEGYTMTAGVPIGVSNEITAETAELRLSSGLVLIVMTDR